MPRRRGEPPQLHPSPHPRAIRNLRPWLRHYATSALHAAWEGVGRIGALGPDHPRARRFGAFGEGSMLAFPPGAVYNEAWIKVGSHTMIGPHVSISAGMLPGQEMIIDTVVSIGDRCLIGRGSHIVGHFCIDIGDDVHTGPYVYVTDQNHGYEDIDLPIGVQWPLDAAVSIGAGSWLGAGAVVLPGAQVGKHVVIGAGSVVTGNIPDYCVAVGAPARVVRRYVPGQGWTRVGPDATDLSDASDATDVTDMTHVPDLADLTDLTFRGRSPGRSAGQPFA
ncbi:MAG: acyltransferase [Actinobacteria bacterium]|nr:acyltransferase [Actinomycetota bacterium]MDA8183261.1 acyltransferase [Actinomycetota bacterium]